MNQIVYVVINAETEDLFGAYNTKEQAYEALSLCNSESVSVTPILVDDSNVAPRPLVYNNADLEQAERNEIYQALGDRPEDEYEDDEDWDEDEDEDEEVTAEDILRLIAAAIYAYVDED